MSDLSRTIHNPPTTDDARAIAASIGADATASALLPASPVTASAVTAAYVGSPSEAGGLAGVLGCSRHYKKPFTFDSPGLLAGTFQAFTPQVGDTWLNWWVEVTEAWDGTTPKFDLGMFLNGQTAGFLASGVGTEDLTVVDDDQGTPLGSTPTPGYAIPSAWDKNTDGANFSAFVNGGRIWPGRFTHAYPICLAVSQNGLPGGTDPESTQGAAVFHIIVDTPIAL